MALDARLLQGFRSFRTGLGDADTDALNLFRQTNDAARYWYAQGDVRTGDMKLADAQAIYDSNDYVKGQSGGSLEYTHQIRDQVTGGPVVTVTDSSGKTSAPLEQYREQRTLDVTIAKNAKPDSVSAAWFDSLKNSAKSAAESAKSAAESVKNLGNLSTPTKIGIGLVGALVVARALRLV